MTTPHVQSFVLISMLRGQQKTPPSGDDLAVLDYHLKQLNPKGHQDFIKSSLSSDLEVGG